MTTATLTPRRLGREPSSTLARMRAPITLDLHITNFTYPDTPAERCSSGCSTSPRRPRTPASARVGDGPPAPDRGRGAAENWMLEGNVDARRRSPARTQAREPRVAGGRRDLPQPGAAREDDDDARRHLGRPRDPRPRGGVVRGRAPRLRDPLPAAQGALRAPRGRAADRTRDVHRGEGDEWRARHHHVADVLNNPRPLRGDIPILVGGSGERKTLRLVARYADELQPVRRRRARRATCSACSTSHCEDVGRDPAEITRTRMATVIIAPTHEAAQRRLEADAATGVPQRPGGGDDESAIPTRSPSRPRPTPTSASRA